MKKVITILVLGILPALALASGDHAGGHAKEHDEHAAHNMSDMDHDGHAAAAGRPGDPAKVSRTIQVTMDDTMRFEPAQMKFKAGETVRFVVTNNGKIRHEMVIGSMAELQEHSKMMRKNPNMKHAEPNMVTLAPGEQGEVIWQFDKPGAFDFACLIPGHLEAGMTGKIEIR